MSETSKKSDKCSIHSREENRLGRDGKASHLRWSSSWILKSSARFPRS